MQYIDYYNSIKDKVLKELTFNELAFVHLNARDYNDIKHGQIQSILPLVIGEIRHAKFIDILRIFYPLLQHSLF